MKHEHIIIILLMIIVVLVAAVGFMILNPSDSNEPVKLKITSDNKQYEGGKLSIKLTDMNKTPISGEVINVTVTNSKAKVVVDEVVKTNSKGNAKIDLDLKKGKYTVNVTYGGNENYTGNITTQKLTIKEEVKQTQAISSNTQSSNRYDINNLPPSNDPYPETKRYQIDEDHVVQEYEDGYKSVVDLRTGERHGGF